MIRAALIVASIAATASPVAAERSDRRGEASARRSQARHEAEALARRAKLHYGAGRFDRAAAEYLAAYRLYPATGLLYNLAQSYRLAGDCGAARGAYQEYLRRAPTSELRPLVLQHLEDLRSCAVSETVLASDAPVPATGRSLRIAGVLSGGAGLVLAGMGLYVVRSDDDGGPVMTGGRGKDDDDDEPPAGVASGDGDDRDLLGGVLLGSGGAACLAGLTLYLLGSRDGEPRGLAFAPTGDGAEVSIRWRF